MRSVCLFCLFLLVIRSEALNQADFKEPLSINQQIHQKQVFPFPVASSPAPGKTSPSPMPTTPDPVKTNHAPLSTTPAQVNTSPFPVSTSAVPTTPKAPVTDEFLGPSECLDKKRTRSSCDLVFCPPWERCIEGKCSCKPPYLCPVENARPVCGRDHRNYRSYCQAMAVSCRTKKPTMSHFGEDCHASLDKFLSSIDQDSGLVSMFLPNSDGGSDEVLVCQKLWDMAAANVACREQGKSLGTASTNSVPFDSLINKPDRCVSVRCQGYETSLSECVIYDKVMSRYGRVAAVSCYEAPQKPKECGSDFQCANSKCVSVNQTCDGVDDCGDRSDEMCCKSCRNGAFRCKTGVCLHGEAVNDGQIDCLDGEDEAEKHKKKTQTSFRSSADPEKILQQLEHSEFVSPRNETKSSRDHLESKLYCGVPNATTVDDEEEHRRSPRVRRVVGGVPAKPTQIQWQVALVENKRIDCGGAYIGGCWVITAAHCVRPNPSAFKVKFSIWKKFHIQTTSDIVPVEDIRIHPNYNPATYENDIALIQLEKRPFTEECFVKNPAISAVCIPWTPQLFQPNHTCSISGWGRTADGRSARVLLWANVSLIADCQRFYKDRFKPGMMCAGRVRSLSSSLWTLTHLTALHINDNNLTRIPPDIAKLPNLVYLNLSSNKLRSLPAELGNMVSLRELLLNNNLLRVLPYELGRLFQLQTLGLKGNPLSQDILNLYQELDGTRKLLNYMLDNLAVHPEQLPQRPWITLKERDQMMPTATFTVMCYNVLCDKYATRQLYGYCPSWALNWEYRKKGIMEEITSCDADIISLQEVETEQYYTMFLETLKERGYDGYFCPKSRAKLVSEQERKHVDGCAVFFKTEKFTLVQNHTVEFNQVAMANSEGSEVMLNRVMTKDNIGVAILLEVNKDMFSGGMKPPQEQQLILVANAHMHWDPEYSDVKLIQTMMFLSELKSIAERASGSMATDSPTSDPSSIPIVLCADLNSLPDSGVVEYLSNGGVAENHKDFKELRYNECLTNFSCNGKNGNSDGSITHSFQLKSAYDSNLMPYTNYTYDFKGVIDYIFFSKTHMSVLGLLGPLDSQWLVDNNITGCPHPHIPSDHFSLLAQLELHPPLPHPLNPLNGLHLPVHR